MFTLLKIHNHEILINFNKVTYTNENTNLLHLLYYYDCKTYMNTKIKYF